MMRPILRMSMYPNCVRAVLRETYTPALSPHAAEISSKYMLILNEPPRMTRSDSDSSLAHLGGHMHSTFACSLA